MLRAFSFFRCFAATRRFATDFGSTYISKMHVAKVDKSHLTKFFKAVHPDLMAKAPPEFRDQNSKSMQELNSYITALEQNAGTKYTKLEFYVRSQANVGETEVDDYNKRAVELLPIKPNSSTELLRTHIKQYSFSLSNLFS